MTFNSRTTLRPSRTRQWRAIELANRRQHREEKGLASIFALAALAAVVVAALFALPF